MLTALSLGANVVLIAALVLVLRKRRARTLADTLPRRGGSCAKRVSR